MDDDERGETKKQRIVLFPSKIQDEVHDAFKKVMDAQLDSMMQATEKYVERKKKEIEAQKTKKNGLKSIIMAIFASD